VCGSAELLVVNIDTCQNGPRRLPFVHATNRIQTRVGYASQRKTYS
jgi:hypothetical protein